MLRQPKQYRARSQRTAHLIGHLRERCALASEPDNRLFFVQMSCPGLLRTGHRYCNGILRPGARCPQQRTRVGKYQLQLLVIPSHESSPLFVIGWTTRASVHEPHRRQIHPVIPHALPVVLVRGLSELSKRWRDSPHWGGRGERPGLVVVLRHDQRAARGGLSRPPSKSELNPLPTFSSDQSTPMHLLVRLASTETTNWVPLRASCYSHCGVSVVSISAKGMRNTDR
jgi:hypothetical protein